MSPLTREEQRWLLGWARQAIPPALAGPAAALPEKAEGPSERLREPGAAFVSLHKQSQLRGCVGLPQARQPLYLTVAEAAMPSAPPPPRFPPGEAEELSGGQAEVFILSPP